MSVIFENLTSKFKIRLLEFILDVDTAFLSQYFAPFFPRLASVYADPFALYW